MREIKLAGFGKSGRALWEKTKKSLSSFRDGVLPALRKYGDRLLFILALAVLAAAIIRGGGKKVIAGVAVPSIEFTQWWQDEPGENTLQELIKEFEKANGGIRIAVRTVTYGEMRALLFNPSGVFPGDVLAIDPLWAPELLKREVIERAGPQLLSFINVLYYNVEILKEAGFTRPPKNRSEFLDYARAVKAGGALPARNALVRDGNSPRGIYDDVYPWIWAAGARLVKDGEPTLNTRSVTESLSFLSSLHNEGLIYSSDAKPEDFISGSAAFMIAPVKQLKVLRQRMGEEAFGITAVPAPDNYSGKPYYASIGWSIGVNPGSEHREEARLFAAFLAGKASFLSEQTGAIPGTASAPPPASDPFRSKAWDIAIAGESAPDFIDMEGEHELEEIFGEELAALFEGRSSPAEAAGAIQKRWETVMARQN